MFIYRKIHIETQIEKNIFDEIKNLDISHCRENFNYLDINDVKIQCPTLMNWLHNKNTKIFKAAVIITPPKFYNSIPHTDAQLNKLALNFPMYGCDNSETIFYKTETPLEVQLMKKPNGVIYNVIKNRDWIEIDRYILDAVTLLNTHIPHKIINHGDIKRTVLSIRFDPDPWELTDE